MRVSERERDEWKLNREREREGNSWVGQLLHPTRPDNVKQNRLAPALSAMTTRQNEIAEWAGPFVATATGQSLIDIFIFHTSHRLIAVATQLIDRWAWPGFAVQCT